MNLKKIKLAGFKSFVDPTTISLPSHLVAVVGPNGCGKSNVIDAVTWVMGESSAKYLRGESLTDVIFNGSTARKPVGQASVELIFDNQDGSIGGEFATYAEISIRRVITREGDSTYYLNGTRCRRRDIIDIFLGTGLGPRSYSIIGQNMISRIIEARPDDMRIYLEEAAGVSKYKERRRETENRIHHTKENLSRLNDVRVELEKQLNTLQRQANAAEKYKLLKQEERLKRAQHYVIQWRDIEAHNLDFTVQVQQQETGLEARHAELSSLDLTIDQLRNDQRVAGDVFQDVQKRYYTIGNDVTRLEQEIRYHQEKLHQWQSDIDTLENEKQTIHEQIEELETEIQELRAESEYLTPESEKAKEQAEKTKASLLVAEEALQLWQNRWDDFNQRAAKTTQTAQVEQTRIQHLEQKLNTLKQTQLKLEQDKKQINFLQLEEEAHSLKEQLAELDELVEEQQEQLATYTESLSALRHEQQQTANQLDSIKNEIQRFNGQQSSLEALQKTALGQRNQRVVQWLEKNQLNQLPRLAQHLDVEKGWERAVEIVLGATLQAVCVDQLSDLSTQLSELNEGNISFYSNIATTNSLVKPNSLLHKVKSSLSLHSLLGYVYTAENKNEAFALSQELAPHESIITRDGMWVSANWIRIFRDENPESGVFQREQELKQISLRLEELIQLRDELELSLEELREKSKTIELQRETLQRNSNQTHQQTAELRANLKSKEERIHELKNRVERYERELEESSEQIEETQHELIQSKTLWQEALQELEDLADQRETLTNERDASREAVQTLRQEANQAKEEAHQLEIRAQTTRSQYGSLQQTLIRMKSQQSSVTEKQSHLQNELKVASSTAELEDRLSDALNQRLMIEEELNRARIGLAQIDQSLRTDETRRQEVEKEANRIRDRLESLRLEWRELKVKSDTLLEQFKETGFLFEEILKELPPEANAMEWASELEQVTQRITRLGPINLVAIEEFASCSERKIYLDSQFSDLEEGLATLESAIEKIDRETRARFKETFDTVNARFQELFPKIFGGGHAYLELTGDNLLDAGITVMACPPGKRNSTIHLLSGGEKAMTAISLIFSIFHLNPAPFCLLDEVDAPLDDANIGRFCHLVKSMADKTQFIFISHNKLAIEMGEHLIGVTMHEPGVSRLVSVDVEEAINLASV